MTRREFLKNAGQGLLGLALFRPFRRRVTPADYAIDRDAGTVTFREGVLNPWNARAETVLLTRRTTTLYAIDTPFVFPDGTYAKGTGDSPRAKFVRRKDA
jgi:hypothetical protein